MSQAGESSVSGFARVTSVWVSRHSIAVIAGVWFVAAFGTVLWAWGLNPVVFQVTDEAVVRQAARLISQHGNPFLKLPFADPEDLAHMREWMSNGDTALPIYAPVVLYAFGFLLRFHGLGLLLIEVLPASALAAFAAGTARLLPLGRRWLALLAPLLGFVSFYWILHPWLNLSPVLAGLCWAFLFWTCWRDDRRMRWLVATTLCIGAASAIRPDYAAFLLLSMVLLLLASDLGQWRLILGLAILSGVCALVPNLILNKLTTGHALRAVYQIAMDRQYGADGTHGLDNTHGFPGLGMLRVLLVPMGFPTLTVAFTQFKKYFITMSVAPLLLLAQLALIPLLRGVARNARILHLLLLLLAVFFVVTHLHGELFGDDEPRGYVYHSVPRYLSPVFLFAALPPLLWLGRLRLKVPLVLGAALACAVAAKSAYEVFVNQPASLADIHQWVAARTILLNAFAKKIPNNAIVYSAYQDKLLWSRWYVGVIVDPIQQTATSINRAVEAGLPVFLLEPKAGSQFKQLKALLSAKQFKLVRLDGRRGLYRLDRQPSPALPAAVAPMPDVPTPALPPQ
jgi:hypothetical protein